MDHHDSALVLTRVMTSGVVMSIEKSDRELPGLATLLSRLTGRAHVSLVNSRSAGLHAGVVALGLGHGDTLPGHALGERDERFLAWLGLERAGDAGAAHDPAQDPAHDSAHLALVEVGPDTDRTALSGHPAPALVLDLAPFGFGPAAALVTDDEQAWARAERLKIFGAYDLRTMWTQQEADASLVPGVQFNYRLSPLVAACIRMAANRALTSTGAA